jgi:AbiV family abortive infection protein
MSNKEGADSTKDGFAAVEAALEFGGKVFNSADDFNTALDHVVRLLDDAVALFGLGSFGSAAFLAISALEETSKANIGTYRRDKPEGLSKGRDPLRDHKAKHSMAVLPTVFMTGRIVGALGQDRADALRQEAQSTGFTTVREASLYCARTQSGFVSPKNSIPALRAWELIILAIEAADDALVGMTNHSFEVGKRFDELFVRMVSERPAAAARSGH